MRKETSRFLPLLALGVYPFLALLYNLLNARNVPTTTLLTKLDTHIPFNEWFVIPYLLWFPFTFLTLLYFLYHDKKIYYAVILTDTIGRLLCFVIYYFFPTTVPRPHVEGINLGQKLVLWLYSQDFPTNCFPSIHCLSTILIMFALTSSTFKHSLTKVIIYATGFMIILSTMFIKQHVFLDVLSSALISITLYPLVYQLLRQNSPSTRKAIAVERSN